MPAQALAAVATLLSFSAHGNRVELQLDHGAAELVWATPSTFRFRRTLDGPLLPVQHPNYPAVSLQIDDVPGAVRMRSKYLQVSLEKHGLLLRVQRFDGSALMADLSEPQPSAAGVAWDRRLPPGARFYGLGPRTDPGFDLRGKSVNAALPLLISTAGYGEYHPGGGPYRFDFTAQDRYRIHAPGVDYFFYYGPSTKQIFEEHEAVRGTPEPWPASTDRFGSWATLKATLLRLVHGAMSAALMPTLSLRPYDRMPAELVQRARQIGSLVDDVSPGPLGLSSFRQQLETFFATYAAELRDKGFPLWHPLPFQFPDDPACALHADEFLLGDEMLIAPIYEPGGKRSVYLPQGIWTNLETNQEIPGRRTITVETASLPVFARNGTIVPLDSDGALVLHYFPTLAAEFFLLENDTQEWSQVHASPAADIMRLEIEAKKARDYEWVIHHVDRPSEVSFEDQKYREVPTAAALTNRTWWYDAARRNLQVRVRVAQGEDCIINLSF